MPHKDPEKRKEYQKKYHENNREKKSKYHKRYYKKNKEKWKDYVKRWRESNLEKMLEQGRKRYQDNHERLLERSKNYFKTEKGRANHQRAKVKRQTIMENIINTLTSEEWLNILKKYNYKCAYCGTEFDENILPEKDHIIPISKGGNNTKENIVPACRSCNAKKGDKILLERQVKNNGIGFNCNLEYT